MIYYNPFAPRPTTGDKVVQLPVSVSAPADVLANVQEETKFCRNDCFST